MTIRNGRARGVALVLLGCVAAAPIAAIDAIPVAAGQAATVDGRFSPGEYPTVIEERQMRLGLVVNGGMLYVVAEAQTSGWVAVGLGSDRMDGSHIMISYVTNSGPFFVEQVGEANTHSDTTISIVNAHAVVEVGNLTTLEVAIPVAELLSRVNENGELGFIYAFAVRDNVRAIHRFNKANLIKLPS